MMGPKRFFDTYDIDGDGEVSEEEFIENYLARLDAFFERLDGDGDGRISLEEHGGPPMLFGRKEPRGRGDEERSGDKEAAPSTVATCVRQKAAQLSPQTGTLADTLFEDIDNDGDGMLSLKEISNALSEVAAAQFALIDADGDGFVTEDEAVIFVRQLSDASRSLRDCAQSVA
jgi:Ca2+-binding EF-hand superfamily protein